MALFSKRNGGFFGSLLGAARREPALESGMRPMREDDLAPAIAIIEAHDEDDAEEAEAAIIERQGEGMFVVERDGEVVGITGAVSDPNVDDIRWLSWTYVREDARRQGIANLMIQDLLRLLDEDGVRKIFIATSDYKEDGEDVYADARAFYEELGASEELRVPDYHGSGEAKIIYGLENPGFLAGEPLTAETAGLVFTDLGEASESEAGFGLIWTEGESGVEGLERQLDLARERGARAVFLELPEDLSDLASPALNAAGFKMVGRLQDYYGVAAHQMHWAHFPR